ncbi:alpha/beta fold hydrolase [Novosphingobium rosa]|uniref:alpha/beta fold hydrolase n=1 Tax=Novosphingobium rosa TaxID=76978 RepID=UPI0012EECDD0|nr:alpha/beta fold hydrolase [Novosphingobium rosa]
MSPRGRASRMSPSSFCIAPPTRWTPGSDGRIGWGITGSSTGGFRSISQVGSQRPLTQTLEAMANDLVAFLREFGIGSINLMGIGSAASHALATAALFPDRVRSIVICGAPDHLPSPAPKRSRSEGKLQFCGNASSAELDGMLAEVSAPTLVMAPMRDGPASVEYQVNLADLLPSATLLPVNATQEDVLLRPSEDCIAAVRRFLAVPPASRPSS